MNTSDAASTPSGSRELSLVTEKSDSSLLIRLAGQLDLATIGRVMIALDRVEVDRTTRVLFDLAELDFLDAAGLGVLLQANDYCNEHGIQMTVVKPHGLASRVFTLTRACRELDFADSCPRSSSLLDAGAPGHKPRRDRRWRPAARGGGIKLLNMSWPQLRSR